MLGAGRGRKTDYFQNRRYHPTRVGTQSDLRGEKVGLYLTEVRFLLSPGWFVASLIVWAMSTSLGIAYICKYQTLG